LHFVKAKEIFFLCDTMDKKTGQRIKTLRIEKSLTQEDLGEKLGLDRGTISKIERGENAPTVKTLIALREIFGVSVDWVLTGKGLKNPIDIDDDLMEMIEDLTNNHTAKIKVLSFFYNYKAKNLSQFVKKKNKKMKDDIEEVEE
jgi:transcriptional regulator with XRE-family HTH domain